MDALGKGMLKILLSNMRAAQVGEGDGKTNHESMGC